VIQPARALAVTAFIVIARSLRHVQDRSARFITVRLNISPAILRPDSWTAIAIRSVFEYASPDRYQVVQLTYKVPDSASFR